MEGNLLVARELNEKWANLQGGNALALIPLFAIAVVLIYNKVLGIILKIYCIGKLVFMTLVKNAVMQRKYLKPGRWGVVKLIEREFEKEGKDNQKSSVSKLLPSKIPREINILQSIVRICGPEAR